MRSNVVPGSDGAGIVLAVGKSVTKFSPGDKVVTIINPHHIAGSLNPQTSKFGLGGSVDGTFRTIGAFDEQGLVAMPVGLTFIEAATLSCAGLTAWNALFGLSGRELKAGQWLLTQGTGGVSLFAIQFAKAVGARVIATTSSNDKVKLLERLGVDHVLNYRDVSDWGLQAKKLTGGTGVDMVVDVAGPVSLTQSAASVKLDGLINVVGFVGGEREGATIPTLLEAWINLYIARGVHIGSRLQMQDMCRAIEANLEKLRPVLDSRVFTLDELREAYEYTWKGKHTGKVCIQID